MPKIFWLKGVIEENDFTYLADNLGRRFSSSHYVCIFLVHNPSKPLHGIATTLSAAS